MRRSGSKRSESPERSHSPQTENQLGRNRGCSNGDNVKNSEAKGWWIEWARSGTRSQSTTTPGLDEAIWTHGRIGHLPGLVLIAQPSRARHDLEPHTQIPRKDNGPAENQQKHKKRRRAARNPRVIATQVHSSGIENGPDDCHKREKTEDTHQRCNSRKSEGQKDCADPTATGDESILHE